MIVFSNAQGKEEHNTEKIYLPKYTVVKDPTLTL